MAIALHRWLCRPRILASVAVLSLVYYVVFMEGGPRQWRERFEREGEVIDESLEAVLNETLRVSCCGFFLCGFGTGRSSPLVFSLKR